MPLGPAIFASGAWKQYNPVVNRRNFLLTAGTLAGLPAPPQSTAERPPNAVRGVQWLFTTGEPRFYNREMRPRYLARLAESRFSRFNERLRRMVMPLRFEF